MAEGLVGQWLCPSCAAGPGLLGPVAVAVTVPWAEGAGRPAEAGTSRTSPRLGLGVGRAAWFRPCGHGCCGCHVSWPGEPRACHGAWFHLPCFTAREPTTGVTFLRPGMCQDSSQGPGVGRAGSQRRQAGPRLPWTGAAGGWGPRGPFACTPMLLFLNKARVDGTRLHAFLRRPQPGAGLQGGNFLETRLDQMQGDLGG